MCIPENHDFRCLGSSRARPAPATMLEMMSAVFLIDHKKNVFFVKKYFPALCTALQPRSSRAKQ